MKTFSNTSQAIEGLSSEYDSTLILVNSFCKGQTKLNDLLNNYPKDQIIKAASYILGKITDNSKNRSTLYSLLKRLTSDSLGEKI